MVIILKLNLINHFFVNFFQKNFQLMILWHLLNLNLKTQKEENTMFSFDDVKMMFDWGCFTEDQVREFVPLCITDEEANKIVTKPL